MRRIILGISFFFIIASVFVIGLALHNPDSPTISTPTAPQIISESAAPQAAAPVASASAPPSTETTAKGAINKTIELLMQRQDANVSEITQLKSMIAQLEQELKNRDVPKKDPKPQAPDWQGETLLVLGAGVFHSGQVEPSQGGRESLNGIVAVLKERSRNTVAVEGHSDSYSVESDSTLAAEENRSISIQRAQAVARVLEQQGIPADKIVVRGYGDTRPVASNSTLQGRSQNRRVEIKLIPSLERQ